jgi:hypothetical protein
MCIVLAHILLRSLERVCLGVDLHLHVFVDILPLGALSITHAIILLIISGLLLPTSIVGFAIHGVHDLLLPVGDGITVRCLQGVLSLEVVEALEVPTSFLIAISLAYIGPLFFLPLDLEGWLEVLHDISCQLRCL